MGLGVGLGLGHIDGCAIDARAIDDLGDPPKELIPGWGWGSGWGSEGKGPCSLSKLRCMPRLRCVPRPYSQTCPNLGGVDCFCCDLYSVDKAVARWSAAVLAGLDPLGFHCTRSLASCAHGAGVGPE